MLRSKDNSRRQQSRSSFDIHQSYSSQQPAGQSHDQQQSTLSCREPTSMPGTFDDYPDATQRHAYEPFQATDTSFFNSRYGEDAPPIPILPQRLPPTPPRSTAKMSGAPAARAAPINYATQAPETSDAWISEADVSPAIQAAREPSLSQRPSTPARHGRAPSSEMRRRPAQPMSPVRSSSLARAANPARVVEPSIKTGDEGKAWEEFLGDMSLHDEKENQFLDLVDEMRGHGLDRELSLPRLVVCGKQSSGKSSVLEAITRLPFPRGDGTCTRFVTEIRMIRDSTATETSVLVSIRPGRSRGSDDANTLKGFKETCTPADFTSLFSKAAEAMGIMDGSSGETASFSRDVLDIEIKGPHCQRISLIDLPGLIGVNKGDKDDISFVESITDEYIREDRTIILCVVNAGGTNIDDHTILEKAKVVDPSGERTFGIITKPDRLEAGLGDEKQWLSLAHQDNDAIFTFGKGCHVMVNRDGHATAAGTSSHARDQAEQDFFAAPTWSTDSGKNAGKRNRWHELYLTKWWGVNHLRPRLTRLLFRHTQNQMKALRDDINLRISKYDSDSARLSVGLLERDQLRELLLEMCGKMSHTARQGVDSTLRDPDFYGVDKFEAPNGAARFLRDKIREESEQFRDKLKEKGHKLGYAWNPDGPVPTDFAGVEKFYNFLLKTRGTELDGNIDPQRTTLLFIEYSRPWNEIAQKFLNQTYFHAREFIKIVVNQEVGKALPHIAVQFRQNVLEERLEELKAKADEQLGEIEEDRKRDTFTQDERFGKERAKLVMERLHAKVEERKKVDATGTASPAEPEDMRREAAMVMIGEMHIYYRIKRAQYIDNIIAQVVERCVLSKLWKLFKANWVLKDEQFDRVTSDPTAEDRRQEKARVEEKRKNLKNCLMHLESLEE